MQGKWILDKDYIEAEGKVNEHTFNGQWNLRNIE